MASDQSKRHTLCMSATQAQYDFVVARSRAKGVSVSDYLRNLVARGLRLEVAEEKKTSANEQADGLDDYFA